MSRPWKERIIELVFTKDKRAGCPNIQDLSGMNLAGIGLTYIRWSLGLEDKEIGRVWKEELDSADPIFEDRIRQNVGHSEAGFCGMMARFASEIGIEVDVNNLAIVLEESQRQSLIGEGPRAKNDVDMILESLSAMAAAEYRFFDQWVRL